MFSQSKRGRSSVISVTFIFYISPSVNAEVYIEY